MASSIARAAEEPIPPLRPLRGELAPGFWEVFGGWVVLGAALLAAAIVAAYMHRRRKKPVVPTPPDARARQAVEGLRGRTEDVPLVAEVSRLLRQYLVAAYGLPPEELTTSELQQALRSRSPIVHGAVSSPEKKAAFVSEPHFSGAAASAATGVIGDVMAFLRQCDERKFAPTAPPAPLNAVERALDLIRQVEAQRQPVPPPGADTASPAPASARP